MGGWAGDQRPTLLVQLQVFIDTQASTDGTRGHFERLFSTSEWDQHFDAAGALSGADDDPYDDESESTHTSSSDDDNTGIKEECAETTEKDNKPIADTTAPPEPDPETNDHGDDADIEDFSDISDNSDVDNVSAEAGKNWVTPEDEDRALVQELKHKLRTYPLMPPHPDDPTKSFMDVDSGIRLASLHCAIRGCSFSNHVSPEHHWSAERMIYRHLKAEHATKEMSQIFRHATPLPLQNI